MANNLLSIKFTNNLYAKICRLGQIKPCKIHDLMRDDYSYVMAGEWAKKYQAIKIFFLTADQNKWS